jgi:hypothetical protein
LREAEWPWARPPYLLKTSQPGVFAAGDVRGGNIKRVASAVGEGSIAVAFIHRVLQDIERDVMTSDGCSHIGEIAEIKAPATHRCEECVKMGSTWLHLRTCQTCGVTLCCDNSPQRHATKHAHGNGHPVIASAEPGERWLYCYPDDTFAEY